MYSPTLGRFLQTDPIGYEDQFNLYAYVGNDPINAVDPTGEAGVVGAIIGAGSEILIQRAEGTDWKDIDLGDVAVSAALGAAGLGTITKGVQAYKAYKNYKKSEKAVKAAQKYANNKAAQNSNKLVKQAQRRLDAKKNASRTAVKNAVRAAATTAGAAAGSKAAKEVPPFITPEKIKDEYEKRKIH